MSNWKKSYQSSFWVWELNAENKCAHLRFLYHYASHCTNETNLPIRYFTGFAVSELRKFIWNNLQDDHEDRRLGSDYVQIGFAHRALLGLPLLHDSIITPTLKYQTAALGSRRKESQYRRIHEQNVHVQLLWNKLFFPRYISKTCAPLCQEENI